MPLHRHPLVSNFEFYHAESDTWLSARVPGCIHTDLVHHRLIPDPFFGRNEVALQWIERRDWRYRARFDIPEEVAAAGSVDLVFDGLDTLAEVTLNGITVGRSESMFIAYRWDVRALLRPTGNQLELVFRNTLDYLREHETWQPFRERNDPVGGRSRIRKEQCQYAWDWGPRFVTSGVWRPVRLEAWSGARLDDVRLCQEHLSDGAVRLLATPFLRGARGGETVALTVTRDGTSLLASKAAAGVLEIEVREPQLWWPHGQGAQPLYSVALTLRDGEGKILDTWNRRIGLRTVELVRATDADGESFAFHVNGRPVFAKGANWIPDHAFVTECTRERYQERLGAAVDAHMNMIRVWGGGIYEHDDFYEVCDELGLLVWQDFMFACAIYPGAPEFCELVRREAEHQIRRLRHHACLALWCGNNEIVMMDVYIAELRRDPTKWADYQRVFHGVLPEAVAEFDPATPYWPSSPWTPPQYSAEANHERAGDTHFWEVWHARAPVKAYEKLTTRFCSEFGMQSYASAELAATFCPPDALNVFSLVMESHQKNGGGNATMLHYMAQRFRYVDGYTNLAYLSQLNQAYCMKVGVEHFRHRLPRTMGALYWQLNDCWPVASWSSIEFGGRWKALHHEARRFFAPSLVYLRTEGDVEIGRYNEIFNRIANYQIFTIHDAPEPLAATLRWGLYTLDGRIIGTEQVRDVELQPRQSLLQGCCAFDETGGRHTREEVYLRAELCDRAGARLSSQTAFFSLPRFIDFADPEIMTGMQLLGDDRFEISLSSCSLAVAVALGFGPLNVWLSDNWFDLPAKETRRVIGRVPAGVGIDELRVKLTVTTLWHSYQPPAQATPCLPDNPARPMT
jgi:beta-mannosidase